MPIKIHHEHLLANIRYHNTQAVREARSLVEDLDFLVKNFTSGNPPQPPHHMGGFSTNELFTHLGARDELIYLARRYGVSEEELAGVMTDPGPAKAVKVN